MYEDNINRDNVMFGSVVYQTAQRFNPTVVRSSIIGFPEDFYMPAESALGHMKWDYFFILLNKYIYF